MQKLFVRPEHGNLGKVVEKLRAEGHTVEIVGWGYPPMYVVADKAIHTEIKEIVEEIDAKATFAEYRADLINRDQMFDVLERFGSTDMEKVCGRLKEDFGNLFVESGNKIQGVGTKLITKYDGINELADLVDAAYKTNEKLFLTIVNEGN